MKKTILVIALLLGVLGLVSAQETLKRDDRDSLGLPAIGNNVGIQRVIRADSTTAKQLYHRAKRYFVETFRSAKAVIDLDDSENFTIVGKGILLAKVKTPIGIISETRLGVIIRIEAKDGRFRYSITDVMVKPQKSVWSDWRVSDLWKSPKMSKSQIRGFGSTLYETAADLEKMMTIILAEKPSDKW